ncbi:5545_t:CDS:2, partial [Paraglomus occultum]
MPRPLRTRKRTVLGERTDNDNHVNVKQGAYGRDSTNTELVKDAATHIELSSKKLSNKTSPATDKSTLCIEDVDVLSNNISDTTVEIKGTEITTPNYLTQRDGSQKPSSDRHQQKLINSHNSKKQLSHDSSCSDHDSDDPFGFAKAERKAKRCNNYGKAKSNDHTTGNEDVEDEIIMVKSSESLSQKSNNSKSKESTACQQTCQTDTGEDLRIQKSNDLEVSAKTSSVEDVIHVHSPESIQHELFPPDNHQPSDEIVLNATVKSEHQQKVKPIAKKSQPSRTRRKRNNGGDKDELNTDAQLDTKQKRRAYKGRNTNNSKKPKLNQTRPETSEPEQIEVYSNDEQEPELESEKLRQDLERRIQHFEEVDKFVLQVDRVTTIDETDEIDQ